MHLQLTVRYIQYIYVATLYGLYVYYVVFTDFFVKEKQWWTKTTVCWFSVRIVLATKRSEYTCVFFNEESEKFH